MSNSAAPAPAPPAPDPAAERPPRTVVRVCPYARAYTAPRFAPTSTAARTSRLKRKSAYCYHYWTLEELTAAYGNSVDIILAQSGMFEEDVDEEGNSRWISRHRVSSARKSQSDSETDDNGNLD